MAIRTALAIVAAVLLVACRPAAPPAGPAPAASAPAPAGGATQGDAPLSPPFTVKVGHPGTFGGSPIFLAKQRGYFTAEGLAVEHEAFKVSADMVPAVATGELHVASGAINPALFNAVTRGVNFTLVADAGSFQPGRANTSLVIRKEVLDSGRYSRLDDLRGMTIGVPGPYTVNHFMLSVIATSMPARNTSSRSIPRRIRFWSGCTTTGLWL